MGSSGKSTRDGVRLRMLDKILTNGQAGLIDLDLNQQQKVLQAASFTDLNDDYSTHELVTELPTEPHDHRVNAVVTPSGGGQALPGSH